MIKRRFYKLDHGDKDAPSESSSSSDSELDPVASNDSEEEDFSSVQVKRKGEPGLISGYSSEDSSSHEINYDSSDLPSSDEESGPQRNESHSSVLSTKSFVVEPKVATEQDDKDLLDLPDCVVKHKSVFKCMLCPKIVCLSKETLNSHIKSKRHARSEKLLKEGKLKHMLDPDDSIEESKSDEEDQEIAPPVAVVENSRTRRDKKRALEGLPRSNKKELREKFKRGRTSKKSLGKKRRQQDRD